MAKRIDFDLKSDIDEENNDLIAELTSMKDEMLLDSKDSSDLSDQLNYTSEKNTAKSHKKTKTTNVADEKNALESTVYSLYFKLGLSQTTIKKLSFVKEMSHKSLRAIVHQCVINGIDSMFENYKKQLLKF